MGLIAYQILLLLMAPVGLDISMTVTATLKTMKKIVNFEIESCVNKASYKGELWQ